ncbi:MAG TPA: hypothetical protein ENI61_05365 [Ignavibacteria bacterium]|nr:hypothetical protein [Ignavibacteria bacterium]
MKLKNKMNDTRALRDNGKYIEVGPKEIIEVIKPIFDENVFEIINDKKSIDKKTFNIVKNEKLNKENKE